MGEETDGFHKAHNDVYGHFNESRVVEMVNLRVVSFQEAEELPRQAVSGELPQYGIEAHPVSRRRAAFPTIGEVDTPVYRRAEIPLGAVVKGPAIIEQPDTTVVVGDQQEATIDEAGNLFIRC